MHQKQPSVSLKGQTRGAVARLPKLEKQLAGWLMLTSLLALLASRREKFSIELSNIE